MSSDVSRLRPWFAEDIAKLIKGILFVVRESESTEYQRGFLACAVAVCTVVGIDFNEVRPELDVKV